MYEKVEAGQGERQALDCVIRLSITGGANGVMTGSERCQALRRRRDRSAPLSAISERLCLHFGGRSILSCVIACRRESTIFKDAARFPYHVGAARRGAAAPRTLQLYTA